MDLLKEVNSYIQKHKLLDKSKRYLVALSGGPDSVCLLLVLRQLGYVFDAVHCNFHLRGTESDRDEAFCRQLCEERGIGFHLVHFDTVFYAQTHKQSIELAARNLRYGYFEQLRKDIGAEGICVAHHRDDSVETMLMNLMRGTGLLGLTGIKPQNGRILRPLLCAGRKDIMDYLQQEGQEYVIDSTNNEDDVTRNKIRLNLLPVMKTINGNASENIAHTAERLWQVYRILHTLVKQSAERVSHKDDEDVTYISIDDLNKEISPEYTLYYILSPLGFSPSQIEQIAANLQSASGRTVRSTRYELLFDRSQILLSPIDDSRKKSMRIPETGKYVWEEDEKYVFALSKVSDGFTVSKQPYDVNLDTATIRFPLTLRLTRQGDRFVPFGMKGSKLVSDFLTDRKKSLLEKRRQLIVEDANGNILWVVGERTDNRYRVTTATTDILTIRKVEE